MYPLIPPDDINQEYVPPSNILNDLPDPRQGFPPGTQSWDLNPGPLMRAAVMPDIRVLRGLLKSGFPPTDHMVGPLNGPWQSALTRAVMAGPDFEPHVRLLIESGAQPNGMPDWNYPTGSTRFLRGRRPEDTMSAGCYLPQLEKALAAVQPREMVRQPTAALTTAEKQARQQQRGRFWAEANFPFSGFPSNSPPSVLTAAIAVGNTALYEYLVEHGADETAWVDDESRHVTSLSEQDLPVSYFVVESPLLAAVRAHDRAAVAFLLGRGYRPDAFPLVIPTRSRHALMEALDVDHLWPEALNLLLPHVDVNVRTPLFGCHLLHFAVATLDQEVVQRVWDAMGGKTTDTEDTDGVLKTALGHTLLHIASLPIDDTVALLHADEIRASVHEFRTTSATWAALEFLPGTTADPFTMHEVCRTREMSPPPGHFYGGNGRLRTARHQYTEFRDLLPEEQRAQAAMLLFLLDKGIVSMAHVGDADMHGNTVLHYLVSVRNPDENLLETLRQRIEEEGGHEEWTRLWTNSSNVYGFSPRDLKQAGEAARKEPSLRSIRRNGGPVRRGARFRHGDWRPGDQEELPPNWGRRRGGRGFGRSGQF